MTRVHNANSDTTGRSSGSGQADEGHATPGDGAVYRTDESKAAENLVPSRISDNDVDSSDPDLSSDYTPQVQGDQGEQVEASPVDEDPEATARLRSSSEMANSPSIRKMKLRRGLLAGGLGIVLVGAGVVGGLLFSDPTKSDEYQRQTVNYDIIQGAYEILSDKYDALEEKVEKQEGALAEREEAVKAAEGALARETAAVEAREKAVSSAEQTKAATNIVDGTWTVGRDIEPGVYRSAEPVGSRCYWGIYRSGTNGSDILENDIPGGGHPVVTLSEGQDFNSSRCGTWTKQ